MQTFSFMRRNSSNKKSLSPTKIGLIVLAIIIYCSFSDIVMWLPPLLGLFFALAVKSYEQKQYNLIYLYCGFFLFLEANKDFPTFSTILFFFFSIEFVINYAKKIINNEKVLLALLVTWAYLGFYVFLKLMGNFFDIELPPLNWWWAFYIAVEIILAWIFV